MQAVINKMKDILTITRFHTEKTNENWYPRPCRTNPVNETCNIWLVYHSKVFALLPLRLLSRKNNESVKILGDCSITNLVLNFRWELELFYVPLSKCLENSIFCRIHLIFGKKSIVLVRRYGCPLKLHSLNEAAVGSEKTSSVLHSIGDRRSC